jgi:predicted ATPase/predicted negative regulator of RcsB-dependent stress response
MDGNNLTKEALSASPLIRTPDQRVRVFVSSTLDELAAERVAVREAITQLRLTPVFFESGARPYAPRELYRAYLEQSDIFVGIYWQHYGWIVPTMDISGLEDEYQLSAGKPRLIYIKSPAPEREPSLQRLLDRIRADGVTSYQKFATVQELRERLANDLALLLTERFIQSPHIANAVNPAPLPVARGRLIDREREVALIRDLLMREDVGVVTLTGPGGVGKTRVAIQVASDLASQFSDGVAFVSLALLKTPELVVQTLAQALRVSETPGQAISESLLDYFRTRQLLLVLDNAEQIISAAPLATQALESAPRLKVLVTSREALRLIPERVVPIQPLALPDPGHLPDLDTLAQIPSVALFLDRARAVNPGFALTTDNVEAVIRICRRLDGLPLALELAAARLSVFGPNALLARMERSLPLLTQGARDLPLRQQTLRNTLAWSYDLLSEREQQVFRQMAVFVGSFSLEAVEFICTDEHHDGNEVMERITELVEKSLIEPADAGGAVPRFRMLDTVKEYALDMLTASGEEETFKSRHADYYLNLAEAAESHLLRPERGMWLEHLDRVHDNVRAALTWSSEHSAVQTGLRLAGALTWYWYLRGNLREGRTFLERLLAQNGQADISLARGKALYGASLLTRTQGNLEMASQEAQESVFLFRALADPYWLAFALARLGDIQVSQGRVEAARSSLEESRSLFQEQGIPLFEAFVLRYLGQAAFVSHDLVEAKTLFQQSLALFQQERDVLGEALTLGALGAVAMEQGDSETAQSLVNESLPLMRVADDPRYLKQFLLMAGTVRLRQGDVQQAQNLFTESLRLWNNTEDQENTAGIRWSLIGLAEVATTRGQAEQAGRLLGAAEMLSPNLLNDFGEMSAINLDQEIAQVRTRLDQTAFEVGRAAGQAMTQQQATGYTLQDDLVNVAKTG